MSSFPIFNSFQRVGNFPLTDTEVFNTIEDLQDYVTNNPTAYSGQQCIVKGSTPKAYIISTSKELHEQAKQTDVDNKVDKIVSKGLLPLKYVEIQYVEGEGVVPFFTLDNCNKFFSTTFINGIIDKVNNTVYLYTDTEFLLTGGLFKDNTSIVSFKSDAVSNTKAGVFEGCTNLETVELLEIDTLQENMFYRCTSLSILLIPKVKYINATYDVCFNGVSLLSIFKIHISTKYEYSGEPHQLITDILLNNGGCSIEYTILNFPDDISSFIGSLEETEVFSLIELGKSFELLVRDKIKNVGYKINLLNLSQTLGINSVYLSTIISKTVSSLEVNDSIVVSINENGNTELKTITYSQLVSILQAYFDTQYNNYTHPTNHPASVISQDSSNRFVSDKEKNTWNNKSNFSGAYSDLSGKPTLFDGNYNNLSNKPTIPTALSQLSEDATHKHITEAEKLNIPKNSLVVQDFSQPNISIDFSGYDINEDSGFDTNKAITKGDKKIAISNPFLNKVVTVLLPKISEGTVIILPDSCKKLTGDYSDVLQNIIMIHCTKTSPARYLYTISQIQA